MKFSVEPRIEATSSLRFVVMCTSILCAFMFGGLIMAIVGVDPVDTYVAMLEGAIGRSEDWNDGQFYSITETLVKAIPLMITSLAVGVAFKMLFWNIGAEGQLVAGAMAGSGVALFAKDYGLQSTYAVINIVLMCIAGVMGGGLWAIVPAFLKTKFKVNEIITTLMFNYVAILWYQYLFNVAWKDPDGMGFPGTAKFDGIWILGRISGRLHWGLGIALVSGLLVWIILDMSKWGYEIRVIGQNLKAALYGGIDVNRNVLRVMLFSGGLAGLAGTVEVSGVSYSLQEGLNVGYGYTAIIVSWLSRLNPIAIMIVSVVFAGIMVGGDQIQMTMGLPSSVAYVLQGAMLFFVLGGEFFVRYRMTLIIGQRHADS